MNTQGSLAEEAVNSAACAHSAWVHVRDVPHFCGLRAATGAGIIWASIAMGSGELIWWPFLTAKYGAAFIGLLLPSCLLQYFVNREIGRYTITTGEGLFQGFSRLHHLFTTFMWTLMLVTFLWVGSYITSGATALFALTDFPRGWSEKSGSLFWGYTLIAGLTGLLLMGKRTLSIVEWIMRGTILLCIVCILVTVMHPTIHASASAFFSAYFNPAFLFQHGFPTMWDAADSSVLLTAICFAGMGGFLNVMYSYWLRDKGIGMSRMGQHLDRGNIFVQPTGYVFSDTPTNRSRYRAWSRFLALDNGMAVGLNALTAMCMCWFAWSILLPSNTVPTGWGISVVQAAFFEVAMGPVGRIAFLLIAVAFLCDNWVGIVDACARMHADFFRSTFRFAQGYSTTTLYRVFLIAMVVASGLTIPMAQPGTLLLIGGVLNFLAMPIYCPALIYMNYAFLPKIYPAWVRPSLWSLITIVLVSLIYLVLAGWYLATLFIV